MTRAAPSICESAEAHATLEMVRLFDDIAPPLYGRIRAAVTQAYTVAYCQAKLDMRKLGIIEEVGDE